MAHVGVLEALEEAEVPIHAVAGTSIGAIAGAIFARRGRAEDVRQRVKEFLRSETFKEASLHLLADKDSKPEEEEDAGWVANVTGVLRKGLLLSYGVTRRSIISQEEYDALVRALVEDIDIESFKIPFAAVAADLVSGKEIIFHRGSARHAVMASSAIPGVFPPVEEGNRIMVDGGWIDAIPVEPCRKIGADFVIAVDISMDLEERMDFRRSINVFLRSNTITRLRMQQLQAAQADLVIKPAVGDLHWADFSNVDGAINLGKEAAQLSLKQLSRAISAKRRKKWLGF